MTASATMPSGLNLDRSEWTRVRFGDVVASVNESIRGDLLDAGIDRYVGLEHLDGGQLQIQRWGDTRESVTFTRRVRPGQTLFGKRRAYQRKTAFADFDAVCSGDILVFEPRDPNLLSPLMLPFVAMSDPFFDHALGTSAGSLSPRTRWGDLAKFEFDLPPLEQQERISRLLWALEGALSAQRDLSNASESAVESAIEIAWLDSPRVAISEIGGCVTGTTPSRRIAEYWQNPDVPFLTPSEVQGGIVQEARQFVSEAGAAVGRLLQPGAVAVVCIGGDLGRSAVTETEAITNQQITSVVGLHPSDAHLLQALLAHPRGRSALSARESTTVVRKLNKSDLMKVHVPWPIDRSGLIELVESHRLTRRAQTMERDALHALRAALIREILVGADL